MKPISVFLVAIAAAAIAVGAPASGLARERALPSATFWMTLTGTERSTYKVDDETEGLGSCRGEGSEVVSFATERRQKIRVQVMKHGALWVSYTASHNWGFPVTAHLQRNLLWSATDGCPRGPEEELACSPSTSVPWALEFMLTPYGHGVDRNKVFLRESRFRYAPDLSYGENFDPWPSCFVDGRQFPSLIYYGDSGRAFGAPLPSRKLLRSGRTRFTTSAHGSLAEDAGPTSLASTEVDWTLTLTRISEKGK
jgi:hypothetical protein